MIRNELVLVIAILSLSLYPIYSFAFNAEDRDAGNYQWGDDYEYSHAPVQNTAYMQDDDGPDYVAMDNNDDVYADNYDTQQAHYAYNGRRNKHRHNEGDESNYGNKFANRLPSTISAPGEKVIVINPRVHAWGAYSPDGKLIRGGNASAGANYCPDIRRRCHSSVGTFRIYSLGSASCKSSRYPLRRSGRNGGAPMPYCMYYNKNQALHGSYALGDANLSHGCVRLHVSDAEWLRFNFANVGTKVIVKPY